MRSILIEKPRLRVKEIVWDSQLNPGPKDPPVDSSQKKSRWLGLSVDTHIYKRGGPAE